MTRILRSFLFLTLLSLGVAAPLQLSHAGSARGEREQGAEQEFKVADANLNRTYQQLLSKLDETSQASVREAQRTWVAFRDAQAKASAALTSIGGTYHTDTFEIEARVELTNARLEELKRALQEVTPAQTH